MNCPKCRTPIDGIQQFCMNCGTNVFATKDVSSSKNSDTFIMIFLAYLFFSEFISFIIQQFVSDWYEPPLKYLFILLNIIAGVSTFLLAAAIQDKSKKPIAMVIVALHALYIIYGNIDWLMGGF